mgnify:CR=1 FL=1
MSNHQYVVIVGCGQTGSRLANRLSVMGHSVVVIDQRRDAFAALGAEFSGFCLEGDGTDKACLDQAKISQADLVVAVTREDTVNMMVAQVTRHLWHIPRVVARVFHPALAAFCRKLGLETICPADTAADAVLRLAGLDGGPAGVGDGR